MPAGPSWNRGGDVWNWVSTNPAPLLDKAHQSTIAPVCTSTISTGPHTLNCERGRYLSLTFTWTRPTSRREVMLECNDGTWNHRASGVRTISITVWLERPAAASSAPCPPQASGCSLRSPPARLAWKAPRSRRDLHPLRRSRFIRRHGQTHRGQHHGDEPSGH